MSDPTKKKYSVRMDAVVGVRCEDVEASCQLEAIDIVTDKLQGELHELFDRTTPNHNDVKHIEFTDTFEGFLVDEEGDEDEYLKSRWWDDEGLVPLDDLPLTDADIEYLKKNKPATYEHIKDKFWLFEKEEDDAERT
jgi:hypothetical protein